jgi:hypothetical protein
MGVGPTDNKTEVDTTVEASEGAKKKDVTDPVGLSSASKLRTEIALARHEGAKNQAPSSDASTDPRWDVDGFHAFCESNGLRFIRLGHLRQSVETDQVVERVVEQPEAHVGQPPLKDCLFAVVSPTLSLPFGALLDGVWASLMRPLVAQLVATLPGASVPDSALIFWEVLSLPAQTNAALRDATLQRLFTLYDVRTVVVPGDAAVANDAQFVAAYGATSACVPPLFEQPWPMACLALSACCQRVVNAAADEIRAASTTSRALSPTATLFVRTTSDASRRCSRAPCGRCAPSAPTRSDSSGCASARRSRGCACRSSIALRTAACCSLVGRSSRRARTSWVCRPTARASLWSATHG